MAGLYVVLAAADPSGRLAASVEAYPVNVALDPTQVPAPWRLSNERLFLDRNDLDGSGIEIAGESVDQALLDRKTAFCRSFLSCMFFELMLFETHALERANAPESSVIVRPVLLDSNPLWPYLNDFDFWFFVAAMGGSVGAAFTPGKHRVKAP
jgi:hypothetical protein